MTRRFSLFNPPDRGVSNSALTSETGKFNNALLSDSRLFFFKEPVYVFYRLVPLPATALIATVQEAERLAELFCLAHSLKNLFLTIKFFTL